MTRRIIIAAAFTLSCGAAARADALAVPTDVFDAYPPQTLALPTNGRVAFFGSTEPDMSFVRTLPDGTELAIDHQQIASAREGIYLVNPGELTAGEPLVVSSRCASGCGFQATWTVDAFVDDSAPLFADGPIDTSVLPIREQQIGLGVGAAFSVNVVLPTVADDSGPVLILVEGESVAGHVVASEGTPQVAVFSPGGDARTECYRVRALDMGGNETALDDEVCVDLDDGGGCASTSAAAPLPLLSVLSLLALSSLVCRRLR